MSNSEQQENGAINNRNIGNKRNKWKMKTSFPINQHRLESLSNFDQMSTCSCYLLSHQYLRQFIHLVAKVFPILSTARSFIRQPWKPARNLHKMRLKWTKSSRKHLHIWFQTNQKWIEIFNRKRSPIIGSKSARHSNEDTVKKQLKFQANMNTFRR